MGSADSLETLDKGTIHVPYWMEQGLRRLHPATLNGVQSKTYALLISGIFRLKFYSCG